MTVSAAKRVNSSRVLSTTTHLTPSDKQSTQAGDMPPCKLPPLHASPRVDKKRRLPAIKSMLSSMISCLLASQWPQDQAMVRKSQKPKNLSKRWCLWATETTQRDSRRCSSDWKRPKWTMARVGRPLLTRLGRGRDRKALFSQTCVLSLLSRQQGHPSHQPGTLNSTKPSARLLWAKYPTQKLSKEAQESQPDFSRPRANFQTLSVDRNSHD